MCTRGHILSHYRYRYLRKEVLFSELSFITIRKIYMMKKVDKGNPANFSKSTPVKVYPHRGEKPRSHNHEKSKPSRKTAKPSTQNAMDTSNPEENKENLRINKKYEAIIKDCLLQGSKYVDEDFPATKASLFCSVHTRDSKQSTEQFLKNAKSITNWQRPENIRRAGEESDWTLIQEPRPSDICQGELGNCWFVAALALLAERKELLAKVLVTKEINSVGVYVIRLFKDGAWKEVIIDDLLPCDAFHRLVFSSCRRKQLWVPLIEKAMSKLHGSYESLQSGSIWDGLNYLTGFVSERIYLKSEEDRELLWGRLLSFFSCGFLMGTTITTSAHSETIYEGKGLVANHVYSVLQVVSHDGNRLIQLRNPWGRFSWKGDWSDSSALWTREMRRALSPNQSHEGVFWMSFQDYMRHFTCLEVCKVRKGWQTYTLDGILPPFADRDCQSCFELICTSATCEVDISLYQSSKRNARERVKLTDIGFIVFETNGSSTVPFKLIEPIELVSSSRRRCVTCNLMLSAGTYCVVPFSFGHWTSQEHKETFYAFTLSIYSSRDISCSAIRPSNYCNILADALISCSNKYGKKKRYSLKEKYDDISTISLNLGSGYSTVIANHSNKFIELQMESRTNRDYSNTRGSFLTCDKLPPQHCQVIQVLTAKDTGKSSRVSNSYQLQVYDNFSQMNADDISKLHEPSISNRISGLHTPRPIVNNAV